MRTSAADASWLALFLHYIVTRIGFNSRLNIHCLISLAASILCLSLRHPHLRLHSSEQVARNRKPPNTHRTLRQTHSTTRAAKLHNPWKFSYGIATASCKHHWRRDEEGCSPCESILSTFGSTSFREAHSFQMNTCCENVINLLPLWSVQTAINHSVLLLRLTVWITIVPSF